MKIGVIGAGTMGSNHTRILANMKNVNVSISDIDKEKCRDVAETFNVSSYYFDHNEMLKKEDLDGVIIATPSRFHKSIFMDCAENGVNALVEKPIAETLEDAKAMIEKAKEKGIKFTVGHVERFNPVVGKMRQLIAEIGEIYLVNTVRAGPFPKRLYGSPGGVLVDLSVHDADIIRYLIGDIDSVYSQIIKSGNQEIYANAMFTINEKIRGSSEFSWISPKRIRTIEIFGTNGMLRGDYHNQQLWFYENPDSGEARNSKNLFEEILLKGQISEGRIIQHPIRPDEPLKLELQNFISGIENKSEMLVKPEDAKKALAVALAILESGKENKTVQIRF